MAWRAFCMAANSSSKARTSGPRESQRLWTTRCTAAISSGPKSRSLRGRRQSGKVEIPPLLGEELLRLRVVVGASDIEPLTIEGQGTDSFPGFDEAQHEIREVQVFPPLDEPQHAGLVHVDAHAHMIGIFWLLAIAGDPAALVELQHAQVDLHVALVGGNGERGLLLSVKGHQVVEVEIGQHVAVHDEEGVVETLHEGE